jgi:hypothetical protein
MKRLPSGLADLSERVRRIRLGNIQRGGRDLSENGLFPHMDEHFPRLGDDIHRPRIIIYG